MGILHFLVLLYERFIACYAISYVVLYIFLALFSYLAIKKHYNSKYFLHVGVLTKSNHAIGVSIIAPALNEENTIVYNVKSLLLQQYLKYEVVIVNDGSSDATLAKLIAEFDLVKVDFFYQEKIHTNTIRGHYKSTNPVYSKLIVVDKINGGSKADASNAGINTSKYPLLLCTDVDCVLRRDTISMLAKPFIENTQKVIAAGAAIRISNSCEFRDGMLFRSHFPTNYFAAFQELEYIRAFIFGRMAWSWINGLLLVSGGLGMFDKESVIDAGGYNHKCIGEDLDLVIRMRKKMIDRNEPCLIKYIPESLCWTEAPANKAIFLRQRVRWARGLVQTLFLHRCIFMNPRYGIMGMFAFPYFFFGEFLVPILEATGLVMLVATIFADGLNYRFFWIITSFIYLFYVAITLVSVYLDQILYKHYTNMKQLLKLLLMVFLEPFMYHPINVFASLKGYWLFFSKQKQKWGVMTRQGFLKNDSEIKIEKA